MNLFGLHELIYFTQTYLFYINLSIFTCTYLESYSELIYFTCILLVHKTGEYSIRYHSIRRTLISTFEVLLFEIVGAEVITR